MPGRVGLDGLVDVLLELRELDDAPDPRRRLVAPEAQVREVRDHVLPPREVRVEPRADLQQRMRPRAHLERAAGGLDHAGDELEEGALAGAVAPDEGHALAAADLEVHAVERHVLRVRPAPPEPEQVEQALPRAPVEAVDLGERRGADGERGAIHSPRARP